MRFSSFTFQVSSLSSKALHWRFYGRKPSETNAIEYSIRLSIGSQQRLRGDFGGDSLLFSQHFK